MNHSPLDKECQVYLAYDGSINADWVSRYAIRIAANLVRKKLILLHIPDGNYPLDKIRLKIKAIENECSFHNVELHSEILPLCKSVLFSLLDSIPPGPQNYCICGSRMTSRGRGFLTGTISEKLLQVRKFNVLAIRVVHPGLLGCPDDLLFPLAGHPRGFYAAMPFLLLFAPVIHKLYLLRIMQVNQLLLRYMSNTRSRAIYRRGIVYVGKIAEEIKHFIEDKDIHIETRVVISANWAKEILVHACELRTRLILLGATEQGFPGKYFRAAKVEEILRKTPCDVAIYRKV